MNTTHGQSPARDPRLRRIERQNNWLWLLTALLLVSLSGAVVFLFFSDSWQVASAGEPGTATAKMLLPSLIGMTVLFSLYVALRQREMHRVRATLIEERIAAESLRSRLSELSALFEMAMEANSRPELSLFLGTVSQRMLMALQAKGSCILMLNPDGPGLRCEVSNGPEPSYARGVVVEPGDPIAGKVARTKAPLMISDREVEKYLPDLAGSDNRPGAILCVPLEAAGSIVGVLHVSRGRPSEAFTPLDLSVVMALAEHLALAIRRIDEFAQLATRTRKLEEANQRLGELNRFKRVALSTVDHEIRTPLTAILSHIDLWRKGRDEPSEQDRNEIIEVVDEQASRLSDFVVEISDLLALELGSQTLNLSATSINRIVGENVAELTPRANQKKVRFEIQLEEGVPERNLDSEKLRRALRYLISNSLRYTTEGGRIEIRTDIEEDGLGRDSIVVRVIDDGVGSSSREISAFVASPEGGIGPTTHRVEALGLGFYLVKEVVELHSGRVWTERLDDRVGLCFGLPIHTDVLPGDAPAETTGLQRAA